MAVETPTQLKTYFQTGDKPTQAQFVNLIDSAIPYLKYTAILTQAGTNAPVAVVLENTLGEVPVWSYLGVGIYILTTIANVFTVNKSFSPQNGIGYYNGNSLNTWYFQASRSSPTTFSVNSRDAAGTLADDLISSGNSIYFQIFIFP